MPKLPVIKPKKWIKILHQLGFLEIRQKGSHLFFYRQKDNSGTVIPIHQKEIGRGLTRKILNEINLMPEEYIKLLNK
jgi:predicted RNA binding protein YcfA (HicA-like mRNA interferase family)